VATSIDARDLDVQHRFQEALAIARGKTTASLNDVETSLWSAVLALGRALIALYLARVVARPRPTDYVHGGAKFVLAETASSEIGTRFGKVEFERPVGRRVGWRRATCDRPIDRALGLCGGFSLPTVLSVTRLCAQLAFANARTIVEIEQGLGLFFEQGFQSWVMGERFLVDLANFMYVNSHFVVTTCFLVWLYLRHNRHFYFVRNMFMVAMGLALIGYLAFPTAPPRFLPELGFIDTISYYADVRHDSALVAIFFNPYAAVPSVHVAFALMMAVPAVLLVRRLAFKAVWALYPAVVTVVVIVTANHWWLDAALGAMVAGVAALAAGGAAVALYLTSEFPRRDNPEEAVRVERPRLAWAPVPGGAWLRVEVAW
jgi:hypothetical protein